MVYADDVQAYQTYEADKLKKTRLIKKSLACANSLPPKRQEQTVPN